MNRLQVESKAKGNHFRVDYDENSIEYYKALYKVYDNKNKGKCFYREYTVTKS